MWKIEKIVSKGDYNYAIVRNHPKATKNGYVLHHRIVMENHLGRFLNPNEVVHHKNGNTKDNRLKNLEIMDNKKHSGMHTSMRGTVYCIYICPECKNIFPKRKSEKGGKIFAACSNSCRLKFSRYIQLHGRTAEVERAISENLVMEFIRFPNDNSEETD